MDNFSFVPSGGVNDTTQFPAKDPAIRAHLQELLDQIKNDLNNTVRAYLKSEVGKVEGFLCTTPPPYRLVLDGTLKSRTVYADLWAFAQTSGILVSDSAWTAGQKGKFSTGDGSTTFRLPDFQTGNRFHRAAGGTLTVGTIQEGETGWWPSSVEQLGFGLTTSAAFVNRVAITNPNNLDPHPKDIALLYCIRY